MVSPHLPYSDQREIRKRIFYRYRTTARCVALYVIAYRTVLRLNCTPARVGTRQGHTLTAVSTADCGGWGSIRINSDVVKIDSDAPKINNAHWRD